MCGCCPVQLPRPPLVCVRACVRACVCVCVCVLLQLRRARCCCSVSLARARSRSRSGGGGRRASVDVLVTLCSLCSVCIHTYPNTRKPLSRSFLFLVSNCLCLPSPSPLCPCPCPLPASLCQSFSCHSRMAPSCACLFSCAISPRSLLAPCSLRASLRFSLFPLPVHLSRTCALSYTGSFPVRLCFCGPPRACRRAPGTGWKGEELQPAGGFPDTRGGLA
jgi:hypothetical protein